MKDSSGSHSHGTTLIQEPSKVRKRPVQARSAVTVEAIREATVQVLLETGADRLTTTRVAERAGVSVGTLYQYFPNKGTLLYAILEEHLMHVLEAMEATCLAQRSRPLTEMVEAVVRAFVEAKLRRSDASVAMYAVASEVGGMTIARRLGKRGRSALTAMLRTAPGVRFEDPEFVAFLMYAAMAGATRAVLEEGASPKMVRSLKKQLVLLCVAYVRSSAEIN